MKIEEIFYKIFGRKPEVTKEDNERLEIIIKTYQMTFDYVLYGL